MHGVVKSNLVEQTRPFVPPATCSQPMPSLMPSSFPLLASVQAALFVLNPLVGNDDGVGACTKQQSHLQLLWPIGGIRLG